MRYVEGNNINFITQGQANRQQNQMLKDAYNKSTGNAGGHQTNNDDDGFWFIFLITCFFDLYKYIIKWVKVQAD